jgi:hypothetical protein
MFPSSFLQTATSTSTSSVDAQREKEKPKKPAFPLPGYIDTLRRIDDNVRINWGEPVNDHTGLDDSLYTTGSPVSDIVTKEVRGDVHQSGYIDGFGLLSCVSVKPERHPFHRHRQHYVQVSTPHPTVENTVEFVLRRQSDLIWRSHLEVLLPDGVNVDSPLGLFALIDEMMVIINGAVMNCATGLQLWSMFDALNPYNKDWKYKGSRFIPVHVPQYSQSAAMSQVFITVKFKPITMVPFDVYWKSLDKALSFMPTDVTKWITKMYLHDPSVNIQPKFRLHQRCVYFNTGVERNYMSGANLKFPWYMHSPVIRVIKEQEGAYTCQVPLNSTQLVQMVCVMCMHPNGKLDTYGDPHPFFSFQLQSTGNMCDAVQDSEEWSDLERRFDFHFPPPSDPRHPRIYAKIFELPKYIEPSLNFLLTHTEKQNSLDPRPSYGPNASRLESLNLAYAWNECAKVGSSILVWTLSENEMITRGCMMGLRYI